MYILLLKYCNIRYVFFILCGNKDYYYYFYYYYYYYFVKVDICFIGLIIRNFLWSLLQITNYIYSP